MTGVLVTVAGVVLVGAFAVGAAALLGVRGRAPFAVAVLVLGAADIVASAIVLSPVDGVTRTGMLVAHALLLAVVAGLWLTRGRPRPPWPAFDRSSRTELGSLGVVSVVLAVAVLLLQLYVLARVAPSNWDSMTYHLSRAAYWLQYQSVGLYPNGSMRQLHSAPNAEILLAWTMLLPGTDRWVEIVQWLSLAGLGAAIFSGARMLRFDAPASALAAVVFMLLPQSLLQSTTTQNDLVVGFFVAAAALFLARGLRDRHRGDLVIAGAALGLAIGTKTTAAMALPALGLIGLVAWRGWRLERRVLAQAAAAMVAGVVAFGSFQYVLNAADTGDPFGGLQSSVSVNAKKHPGQNLVRTMWAFADTGGVQVPWLEPVAQRVGRDVLASKAGRDYPFAVDTAVQEDTSGFGLVGFLVLPLLLLGALVRRRATAGERVLAAGAIIYLFLFGIRIDDNVWVARLMIPAVILAAPLLGVLGRRQWTAGFVLALAVVSGLASLLENPAKPLVEPIGSPTVFSLSRVGQMTVFRPEMAPVIERLQAEVPPTAPLAVVAGEDSWDYPLFGERRQRRVVRLDSPPDPRAAMAEEQVDGIVYLNVGPPPQGAPAVELGPDAWLVRADG